MISNLRHQVPAYLTGLPSANDCYWSNLGAPIAMNQHALQKGEWDANSVCAIGWGISFSFSFLIHKIENVCLICFSAMLWRIAWLIFLGFNWWVLSLRVIKYYEMLGLLCLSEWRMQVQSLFRLWSLETSFLFYPPPLTPLHPPLPTPPCVSILPHRTSDA